MSRCRSCTEDRSAARATLWSVGTIDLSEPTYFTYQNATDYVRLGQAVHTRAAIDADPALLALVEPQTCVDYRQSPPHLRSDCLSPFTLDLDVSFGDLAESRGQSHRIAAAALRSARIPRQCRARCRLGPGQEEVGASVRLAARRHGDQAKRRSCTRREPVFRTTRSTFLRDGPSSRWSRRPRSRITSISSAHCAASTVGTALHVSSTVTLRRLARRTTAPR